MDVKTIVERAGQFVMLVAHSILVISVVTKTTEVIKDTLLEAKVAAAVVE